MYRTEKNVHSSRQIFVEIIELQYVFLDKIEKNLADDNNNATDFNVHDPWETLINQYLVPEEMCGKKMNGQSDSHTDTHPWGRTKFRFQVFKKLLLLMITPMICIFCNLK